MIKTEVLPHKILGVEFAPFFIPIARRLQTLAVLYWVLGFTIINTLGWAWLIWLLFFSNGYQWIALLYLSWVVYDWKTPETGGRSWQFTFCRNWPSWKYMKQYFPIELIKTADLSPDGKYLMCSHPHGVMCAGLQCAVGSNACGWNEKFKGLEARICTLPIQFTFLGWFRETALCGGAVSSTKSSMEYLFRKPKGTVTALVPGGAFEARNWSANEVKLYLLKRKGFIKLALRHGVDLVPSFSFNEQLIYKQIPSDQGSHMKKVQDTIEQVLGFIPVVFFGRGIFNYTFGLLPYRKPINVVIGSPIKVQRITSPTNEDIDKLHAKYVESLKKLYDDYNPIYGDEDVKLIIE